MVKIPLAIVLAAALAAGGGALPRVAGAQDLPSYARPAPSQDETITGRIQSVDDAFHLTIRDDRGFVDNVQLRHGTIINPRGLTLEAGMSVTVIGHNAGQYFDATEIDTPYSYSGEAPSPTYYGPGWWYPGFDYGFGPAFGLGLGYGWGNTVVIVQQPFQGHAWNGQPYRWRTAPVAGTQPNRRYPLGAGQQQRVLTTAPATRYAQPPPQSQTNVYRTQPAYRSAPGPAMRSVPAAPVMRSAPVAPRAAAAPAARQTH
ncbi:MAG TPA: hypothetical protein VGN14_13935 [Candidatus Elarobacter sp.]|jgi:hypothetical protein